MKLIGNILWLLFGGIILAIGWTLSGIVCCITIIGIPLGLQCFKFASFVLWPFGKKIMYNTSGVNFLVNLFWIVFFGWELALTSIIIGIVYCITLIGIPFGIQSMKFAQLAFMPFGARIV